MLNLTQEELGARWRVSPRTLEQWRWRGVGPRYLKIGGRVIYPENEIEHYEARVRAERESQAQPDDQTADAARVGAPDVRRGHSESDRSPVVSLEEHRRRD